MSEKCDILGHRLPRVRAGLSAHGNKTFQSGTYVLTDGMTIESANVVTGIGVTFYVAGGTVRQAGSSDLTLEAPTSGPYKGILFYFERTAATALHELGRGSTTFAFRGAIYGPTQDLSIEGSFAGASPWGMWSSLAPRG